MNAFKTLVVSGGLLLINFSAQSQYIPGASRYHEQALIFSSYQYVGSARIQGIGNTQISLGGDISSIVGNPAGLGFYNRSEVSITPSYNTFTADANYISNQVKSSTGNFNIENFGVVINKTKDDLAPGKWRGGSFGFSFAKINEFNSKIQYRGLNPNNDILDFYVQDANRQDVAGNDLRGITKGAFATYLISEFLDAFVNGPDTTYSPFYERTFFSEFPSQQYPTDQSEIISTSGSQNQWNFSYGGNVNDVIYFGATLGIQSVNYRINKDYQEFYPGLAGDIVDQSRIIEDLATDGIGVNGTFGIIARPVNIVTLGFSLVTPSFISLSERYRSSSRAIYNNFSMTDYGDYFDANYDLIVNPNAAFTTFYEDNATLNEETFNEESFFDYTLTTPLRINGGATVFINKHGFISADIEYLDYSSMKLKGKQGSLEEENMIINGLYKSVVNFRAGAEFRIKKFRIRAGYNLQQSPYKDQNIDLGTQTISGGVGVRSKKFFADIAGSYMTFNTSYAPYTLDNPNDSPFFETSYAQIANSNLSFALTFGLFF